MPLKWQGHFPPHSWASPRASLWEAGQGLIWGAPSLSGRGVWWGLVCLEIQALCCASLPPLLIPPLPHRLQAPLGGTSGCVVQDLPLGLHSLFGEKTAHRE